MKFLRDLISRKREVPQSEPELTPFPPSPGPNGELGFSVAPARPKPSPLRAKRANSDGTADPLALVSKPEDDTVEDQMTSDEAAIEEAVTEYLAETDELAEADAEDAAEIDADEVAESEREDTADLDETPSDDTDDELVACDATSDDEDADDPTEEIEDASGDDETASAEETEDKAEPSEPAPDKAKAKSAETGENEPDEEPEEATPDVALNEDTEALLKEISEKSQAISAETVTRSKGASIWDLDDDVPTADEITTPAASAEPAPVEAPMAVPVRASARQRRTKTRLIGFDKSDGGVVDLFDGSQAAAPTLRAKFPVGWILVVEGPGRGECFSLLSGMSQIGRGEDQAIQLDFGDNAISRNNHAAIVYDPQSRSFLLGHGGKANIVRLNGTPVISNEPLKSGDIIQIGETKLRLVTLCGEDFDWTADGPEENEDVAIA